MYLFVILFIISFLLIWWLSKEIFFSKKSSQSKATFEDKKLEEAALDTTSVQDKLNKKFISKLFEDRFKSNETLKKLKAEKLVGYTLDHDALEGSVKITNNDDATAALVILFETEPSIFDPKTSFRLKENSKVFKTLDKKVETSKVTLQKFLQEA